jgi:type I restriction enzyme R subunit
METDKKKLTEEDIKHLYITPAIEKRWSPERLRMEVQITDGKISLEGNMRVHKNPLKADYILYLNNGYPIAVVEAKDNNHTVSFGMQQAKTYATMMDLKFAYSSNGDGFQEYDFMTGKERSLGLDEFPSEEELIARYRNEINGGQGLTEAEEAIIRQPYYSDQNTYPPRYYQRVAVNRTLDAIARGQNRILLVMATGTGKTLTAFQIVYRLLKAGMKRKVLYLADRNILVDQTIQQDFKPLEKVVHKINFQKEDAASITAHQVYFGLYQQLIGDNDEQRFKNYFANNFFDLIIVDECHRGSAKDDSQWRCILDYFDGATQIGMTATPKETKYASNTTYFGEPVYEYSLNNGIEDGFLAPFRVIDVHMDISNGWRPSKGQRDYYGNEIEDRIYDNSDYDYKLVLQDRNYKVAEEITKYMTETNRRMDKTIVFCADEAHAERMRVLLTNLNSDMCKENPDYVVRITGSDDYGKKKLDYFISVSEPYPVIATTSKLLSTGVDCKMVKLIAIDQWITSMTDFKQIIGRGTRLRVKEGKTDFAVMDFRGVRALFADPAWDGPITVDPDYPPKKPVNPPPPPVDPPETPPVIEEEPEKYYVTPEGGKVTILQRRFSTYDAKGKLLHTESIEDYTKRNFLKNHSTMDEFIKFWDELEKKEAIRKECENFYVDIEALKKEKNMDDVDDFDFLCHIAYDQKPMTRKERAAAVKKGNFFTRFGEKARKVLEALLDKYSDTGISELENKTVLKLPTFARLGSPSAIADMFGGKDKFNNAINQLKNEIYRVR